MSLEGKTALLFAASGQITRAAARALHEHGATLQLAARKPGALADLQRELHLPHPPLQADVLDPASVRACFATAHERTGRIDIVFNGVGPRPAEACYGTLAADLEVDVFDRTVHSMLGGQFVTSSAASAYWRGEGTAGTLLLLTSSMSRVKLSGMPALSAASAGVEGLTRSMAAELGPLGGRAICINPTALPETTTIQETTALQAARMGIPPEVLAEGMGAGALTGRGPTLAEVGQLIAFASSDAGAILNSHVIDADRGTPSVI